MIYVYRAPLGANCHSFNKPCYKVCCQQFNFPGHSYGAIFRLFISLLQTVWLLWSY